MVIIQEVYFCLRLLAEKGDKSQLVTSTSK